MMAWTAAKLTLLNPQQTNNQIPLLAVAVTPSLQSQQELYAWVGEPLHWNRGLDGHPEVDLFEAWVWIFEKVKTEAFGFAPVFVNSWLVLSCPSPAGIACVPLPTCRRGSCGVPAGAPCSCGFPLPSCLIWGQGGQREAFSLFRRDCCHSYKEGPQQRGGVTEKW